MCWGWVACGALGSDGEEESTRVELEGSEGLSGSEGSMGSWMAGGGRLNTLMMTAYNSELVMYWVKVE